MKLPVNSDRSLHPDERTTTEDKLIKSIVGASPDDLTEILRGLAEVGTTKGLQYLERFDNKNKFPSSTFDFAKAIIAARHNRPFKLVIDREDLAPYVPASDCQPISVETTDPGFLSSLKEHHLNTTYNFNLNGFNGYTINAADKELLLLLDNGRDSKLCNTLLDRKSLVGLVYCHCEIRLRWCLMGFVFSEPMNGGLAFNVFDADGNVLYKGKGHADGNEIIITGGNTSHLSELTTRFQLSVCKNDLKLIKGWTEVNTITLLSSINFEH